MLVAGTAWLLPPPATNGAPVLAMPLASEAPAAPVPERSDATVFSERERVAPETEQAAVAQALSYAQKLEAAQDEFDHTYVGFVGEVERRLSSRRIEPLIDAALRCEHPRCPRFVARFVSQPTRKPHSFLKALERRIERDATMQVVARQRLSIALFEMAADSSGSIVVGRALDVGVRLVDRASLRPFVELVCEEGLAGTNAARRVGRVEPLECKTVLLDLALHSRSMDLGLLDSEEPMVWASSRFGAPRELLVRPHERESVPGGMLTTRHADLILSKVLPDVLDGGDEQARQAVAGFALRTSRWTSSGTTLLKALFATPGSDLLGDLGAYASSIEAPWQRLRLVECARWALEDREDIVDPGAQQHIRSVLDAHEATARGEMPEEGPSHEELQFQQRVQVLMDE